MAKKPIGLKAAVIAVLLAVAGFLGYEATLGGGDGKVASDCTVSVSSVASVGPTTSNGSAIVLAAHSGRAWAKIQSNTTSTPVTYLSFDEGAAAVVGLGLRITNTSTPDGITFGRNTDFPYTGIVTAINESTATTSVLVTECRY